MCAAKTMRLSMVSLVMTVLLALCLIVCGLTTTPTVIAVSASAAPPVVLDFYIFAKCSDAEACIKNFYPALHPLVDIVDVRVNYIAKQLAPGSFNCSHGPTECEGTIDQLCVQHLYPKNLTWFDYLYCEEQNRTSIPTNGPACAAQLGLSQPAIDLCHSTIGDWLFNESIARTDAAGETVSCTMNLNDVFWCQHDGGWVNCTEGTDVPSLTKAVCTRYQGSDKPAVCSSFVATQEEQQHAEEAEAQVAAAVAQKMKASLLPSFLASMKNVHAFSKN